MQTLAAIEQGFATRRSRPPDIPGAVEDVLGDASLAETPAAGAARALAAAVQAEGAFRPELPYHNRHHVAEAVMAMGLLCALARLGGLLDAPMSTLGVVAMVGHDRGHDGSPPGDGRLERLAAELTRPVLAAAGLGAPESLVVTDVILATDPRGHGFDLLCQLANEADVFASLLPSRGWRMGAALAAEWRMGGHARAEAVASFSGRLGFLRLYRRFSPPAESLGLSRLVGQQVAAFAWGAASPEEGAAALDRMPRPAAHRRYMDALDAIQEAP